MSNEITDIKSDTGTPADKAPAPVKRSWIARFHGIILFLKASVASQIASWVDMGMGIILSQLCGLDVKLSTALGAVTGGIINCSINYKWTFRANSCSVPAVVVKYAMVWLGSLLLNTYGTDFMTTVFQSSTTLAAWGIKPALCYTVARVGTSLLVSIFWNFMLQRYFVYRYNTDRPVSRRPDHPCGRQIQTQPPERRQHLNTHNPQQYRPHATIFLSTMEEKKIYQENRDSLQLFIYKVINPLVNGLVKAGFTPNMVTTIGFLGNVAAAAMFVMAGIGGQSAGRSLRLVSVGRSGADPVLAVRHARRPGGAARRLASTFGAMYDSVLDRYSELVTLGGLCYAMMQTGYGAGALITFVALIGSIMVSYVRARAEGLGIECKVGFMQRPERVVLTAVSTLAAGIYGVSCPDPAFEPMWIIIVAMGVIAVFANLTAFARIFHSRRELEKKEQSQS